MKGTRTCFWSGTEGPLNRGTNLVNNVHVRNVYTIHSSYYLSEVVSTGDGALYFRVNTDHIREYGRVNISFLNSSSYP